MFSYKDKVNKDAALRSLNEWLMMTEDWTDPYGLPQVVEHNGISVVRDDLIAGTKARAADLLFRNVDANVLVYVQPREGAAGVSLLEAAKNHNKKIKLFMPSSKQMSETQAITIERGADYEFHRIAAMPNLNKIAAQWAEDNGAYFIPLGLRHELVTAALIRVGYSLRCSGFNPKSMAIATSTGTLGRALRIAFPDTHFHSVAVARNLQAGEMGEGIFHSDHRPFLKNTKYPCPFPTYDNYDRKAWEYTVENGVEAMWNVAAKPTLQDKSILDIKSFRKWPKDVGKDEQE